MIETLQFRDKLDAENRHRQSESDALRAALDEEKSSLASRLAGVDDDLRRRIAEEAEAVAARLGKDNAELREANERMRKKMEDDREEMERRMENESKVYIAFIPCLLTFQTLYLNSGTPAKIN